MEKDLWAELHNVDFDVFLWGYDGVDGDFLYFCINFEVQSVRISFFLHFHLLLFLLNDLVVFLSIGFHCFYPNLHNLFFLKSKLELINWVFNNHCIWLFFNSSFFHNFKRWIFCEIILSVFLIIFIFEQIEVTSIENCNIFFHLLSMFPQNPNFFCAFDDLFLLLSPTLIFLSFSGWKSKAITDFLDTFVCKFGDSEFYSMHDRDPFDLGNRVCRFLINF